MPNLQAARKRLEKARAKAAERTAVANGDAGPVVIDVQLSEGCPYPKADAAMAALCAAFPLTLFIQLSVVGLSQAWEPRGPINVAPGKPWSALMLAYDEAVRADEAAWLETDAFRAYLAAKVVRDTEWCAHGGGAFASAREELEDDRDACERFGVPFPDEAAALLARGMARLGDAPQQSAEPAAAPSCPTYTVPARDAVVEVLPERLALGPLGSAFREFGRGGPV